MMKLLETDKNKSDWQDKDQIIKLVKSWVKEGQQPKGTEMNYRAPEVQAYRKVLAALKLRPVEGTTKMILVKEGLIDRKMDRYCLPKTITSQVIHDIHLYHMHLGVNGIVQQAQTVYGCLDCTPQCVDN